MVAALPAAALGLLLYTSSSSSKQAGVGAGLAGLGSAAGGLLLALAAGAFIAGALLYVRSARD
jgi:hypothetical protein